MSDNLTTHDKRALYSRAFDQVIAHYTDLKTAGGISAISRKSRPGSLTIPSTCDFICDVELAVCRELVSVEDRGLFAGLYVHCNLDEKDVEPLHLHFIKERVGKELIDRNIHPVHEYFRGKEVTRGA